jgi:hypothetical protein
LPRGGVRGVAPWKIGKTGHPLDFSEKFFDSKIFSKKIIYYFSS